MGCEFCGENLTFGERGNLITYHRVVFMFDCLPCGASFRACVDCKKDRKNKGEWKCPSCLAIEILTILIDENYYLPNS